MPSVVSVSITDVSIEDVPEVVNEMEAYREWVDTNYAARAVA